MRLSKLTTLVTLSLSLALGAPLAGCAAGPDDAAPEGTTASVSQRVEGGGMDLELGIGTPLEVFDIIKMFQSYESYGQVEIGNGELLQKIEQNQQALEQLQVQMDALQTAVVDAHRDVLNVSALDKTNAIRALFTQYRTVAATKDSAAIETFFKDLREGRASGGTLRWADLASIHDILVGQNGSASLLSLTARVQSARGIAGSKDDLLGSYFVNMQLVQEQGFFLLAAADARNPATNIPAMKEAQKTRVDQQTQSFVDANNEYRGGVIEVETKGRAAQVAACVCTDQRTGLCATGGKLLPDTRWDFADNGPFPNMGGGGSLESGCETARADYISEQKMSMQADLNKTLSDNAKSFYAWTSLRAQTSDVIQVMNAWYGVQNGPTVNAQPLVSAAADGRTTSEFTIDATKLGDPAPGQVKQFTVNYRCDGGGWMAPDPKTVTVPAEANGKTVTLSCPKVAGTVERLVGTYQDPKRPNDPTATITISPITRAMVKWSEGGEWGMSWSLALTPDATKLDVSRQTTWYQNYGYLKADVFSDAKGNVTGIMGPQNTLYTRVK